MGISQKIFFKNHNLAERFGKKDFKFKENML